MLLVIALAALCPTALEAKIAWFSGGWSSEPRPGRSFFALMLIEAIVFLIVRYALTWRRLRMALTPFAGRDGIIRRSEEHTSELQSLMSISYAVFCLKKKNK